MPRKQPKDNEGVKVHIGSDQILQLLTGQTAMQTQLSNIEKAIADVREVVWENQKCLDNHESRLSKLEHDVSLSSRIQAGLSLLLSAVAAWLGIRAK